MASGRYPTDYDARVARYNRDRAMLTAPGEPEKLTEVPAKESAEGVLRSSGILGGRGLQASGQRPYEEGATTLRDVSTPERQIADIPAGKLRYPDTIKSPVPKSAR